MSTYMMDLVGRRFGQIVVTAFSHKRNGRIYWHYRCDCGAERVGSGSTMRCGRLVTCGCGKARHNVKHGASGTPMYVVWGSMIQRCEDPSNIGFRAYGARGITVCGRWRNSYENFLADMGPRPSAEHSIDRINNDGNYEPGNCRWATKTEQQRNRSDNHRITFRGETRCLSEWAEITGISLNAIQYRLRAGWSIQDILTRPVRRWPQKAA